MRAIQIASLDGPQAAQVVEIDEPSGDGEVIIDVHAAGVAFPDALQSRGLYQYKPEMPYTWGLLTSMPRMDRARQERLVRWRFDAMIAATALVASMTLIHNNPADFESIRSAIEISPERFPGLGPLQLTRCDSLI